jgi:hypothetical protein
MRVWWIALATLAAVAAEPGVRAQIVGGTVPSVPVRSDVRLDLTGPETMVLRTGKAELRIAYAKVNQIEYGQNVSRRYAEALLLSPMFLLSKSRKHFVTLGYADEEGRQQALVFRLDKKDIRAVLASFEARTGRRVEYQDNEARKGRG